MVKLPALPVAAGTSVSYGSLTAAGPGAAWLVRTVTQDSGLGTTTLMHLSRTAWTTVSFPSGAGPLIPLSTAQDGSGGLWVEEVYENPRRLRVHVPLQRRKVGPEAPGPLGFLIGLDTRQTRQDWAWDTSGTIYRN
jgi:hypothetical protein